LARGKKAGKPRPRPAARGRIAAARAGDHGYRLFVRNLVLPARIGVHPHERELAQRVRLNVEILAADDGGSAGDDIAGVVSYEDVVLGAKRIIASGHINLVETLAERVADLCLTDPRVFRATVRVEKLDVFKEAESVGVEIERVRPARRRK
jgi:dihydroneopterin aldolase